MSTIPIYFYNSSDENFRFFTYTLMILSHWEIRTAPWRNSSRHTADKSEVCWQCWDRRWRKGIWCRTRGYKSSDTSPTAFVGFESDLKKVDSYSIWFWLIPERVLWSTAPDSERAVNKYAMRPSGKVFGPFIRRNSSWYLKKSRNKLFR